MAVTSTFGLIERFRGGDQDAFTLLFEKYRARLAVLIYYKLSEKLRQRVEVDDILQEVFFAASQEIDKFTYRSPGSFLAWLIRIADHIIIDAARFEGRQKRQAAETLRFRSESNPRGPEPTDSKTPSRLYAGREAIEKLARKLDALPEDYRTVILLAKLEGLTTQEVAERMGKSREAVALLLHRALQRFRQLDQQEQR
jgi:RNA polymerase sigma-70 factor (ECF subfamily)